MATNIPPPYIPGEPNRAVSLMNSLFGMDRNYAGYKPVYPDGTPQWQIDSGDAVPIDYVRQEYGADPATFGPDQEELAAQAGGSVADNRYETPAIPEEINPFADMKNYDIDEGAETWLGRFPAGMRNSDANRILDNQSITPPRWDTDFYEQTGEGTGTGEDTGMGWFDGIGDLGLINMPKPANPELDVQGQIAQEAPPLNEGGINNPAFNRMMASASIPGYQAPDQPSMGSRLIDAISNWWNNRNQAQAQTAPTEVDALNVDPIVPQPPAATPPGPGMVPMGPMPAPPPAPPAYGGSSYAPPPPMQVAGTRGMPPVSDFDFVGSAPSAPASASAAPDTSGLMSSISNWWDRVNKPSSPNNPYMVNEEKFRNVR